MPNETAFESFEKGLNRLVESFGQRLDELKQPGYAEAQLRDDFLNPFFRALGWDMENRAGLIQKEREVEIESATQIGGGRKRADYLFRTDKHDRFVCEAKKPAEELHSRYAFQAKRYAWNKGVWMALLTDFEELKIYIVGGKPHIDEPHVGEWKSWHFRQYPLIARELWDLLARDKIADGSIDKALDALPNKAPGTGKACQQWLIKPDRTRALDTDFLEFLDETRRDLASDIYKNNDHEELAEGNKLTEYCQRIIDRILFLRICEDRDIDTGTTLQSIVETWRKNTGNDDTGRRAHQQPMELHDAPPADYGSSGIRAPKDSLWRGVVRHFRALDRRPPTHVPFFNGNLFKPHDSEKLIIGDEWLAGFISELSADESPYLFDAIASDFSMMSEDLVRVHAFDWPVQFAPILKAGGFDAVIGNPPYLSSAGQESISYFNERYSLSEYQTDFYTYFIEKALKLVKQKGKFSFIVSDSWMKAENFSKLRKHLLGEHRLLRLAVFDFAPFEGATIENSVLVVERGEKPCLIPMDRFTEPGKFQLQCEVDPQKSIERGLIDPMYSEEALELIAKIERKCVPLESLVEVNRGIHAYRTDGYGKTRFGKGPQTKRDKDEQSYHAKKKMDSTYLPEIKGKDVFRFEFVPTGDFISYGDWLAEAREPKYFQNPKATVRKVLGKKLHGTFIREPMAIDQSLYILISPKNDSKQLKFILGILMSGIGAWYLRTKYAIYDTLYPWYTRKQLAAFPIKPLDDKLVVLVDKLLGLMPKLRAATAESEKAVLQNAVTATDQQIDALVYELYGLTDDEIKLVEGGQ